MSWRRGDKIQLVSVNLYARVARVVAYCFPALCTRIRNHLPPSCPLLGVDYESTRFLVSFTVTHTHAIHTSVFTLQERDKHALLPCMYNETLRR